MPVYQPYLTAAHEILCLMLWWGCLVRAIRSDDRVIVSVRFAFTFLSASALAGVAAPVYGFEPTLWSVSMLASITYTQWITTGHWLEGPPERFIHPQFRHRRRRSTDFSDSLQG